MAEHLLFAFLDVDEVPEEPLARREGPPGPLEFRHVGRYARHRDGTPRLVEDRKLHRHVGVQPVRVGQHLLEGASLSRLEDAAIALEERIGDVRRKPGMRRRADGAIAHGGPEVGMPAVDEEVAAGRILDVDRRRGVVDETLQEPGLLPHAPLRIPSARDVEHRADEARDMAHGIGDRRRACQHGADRSIGPHESHLVHVGHALSHALFPPLHHHRHVVGMDGLAPAVAQRTPRVEPAKLVPHVVGERAEPCLVGDQNADRCLRGERVEGGAAVMEGPTRADQPDAGRHQGGDRGEHEQVGHGRRPGARVRFPRQSWYRGTSGPQHVSGGRRGGAHGRRPTRGSCAPRW